MKKKPFKSDGCSGLPYRLLCWLGIEVVLCCCEAHDDDYHKGGTRQERKAADWKFKECVHGQLIVVRADGERACDWILGTSRLSLRSRKRAARWIAQGMCRGVRILGSPFLPIKGARWNFGLPYRKYMRALWRREIKY